MGKNRVPKPTDLSSEARLDMSDGAKKALIDMATDVVKSGKSLAAGIIVLFDLQAEGALDLLIALDREFESDPDGVRLRWQVRCKSRTSLVLFEDVRLVMAKLLQFGVADEPTAKRVLGSPPAGEFRIALVGHEGTLLTTMPLPS